MSEAKALEKVGKEILTGHLQTHTFEVEYRGEKLRFTAKKDTVGDSLDILVGVRKELMKRGLKPGEMQDVEDLIYEIVYLDKVLVERPEFLANLWECPDWDLLHRIFMEVLSWANSFRQTHEVR